MRLHVVLGTNLVRLAGLLYHFIIKILWELRSLGTEWVLTRNSCWVTGLGSQLRWYGVRSYNSDYFFPPSSLSLFAFPPSILDIRSSFLHFLHQIQPRYLSVNTPTQNALGEPSLLFACEVLLRYLSHDYKKKILEKTGAYFYSRELNQEPSSLEMGQLKVIIDVIIFRSTLSTLSSSASCFSKTTDTCGVWNQSFFNQAAGP